MEHDFVYADKEEVKEVRQLLLEIIHKVQDELSEQEGITFQYRIVGSAKRNMITYDRKSNIGFDFDINLYVNDYGDYDDEPEVLRRILRLTFDRIARGYGYSYCEDSTSVLTIKRINTFRSCILHSFDFCIISNQEPDYYIRFDKKANNYVWAKRKADLKEIDEKAKWLKVNGKWSEVREHYLYLKDNNDNKYRKSISIYKETISNLFNIYHNKRRK